MIGFILKWGLILLVCVLVYNRFFGNTEEKENSKRIFTEVGVLAGSVRNLVKTEKVKFDAGKYDQAIEKVGSAINTIKGTAKATAEQIKQLEEKRNKIQEGLDELSEKENVSNNDPKAKKLNADLLKLTDEIEQLSAKDVE